MLHVHANILAMALDCFLSTEIGRTIVDRVLYLEGVFELL